jgi:5-(carboxyamino)imidazole ribonucleotide synthase
MAGAIAEALDYCGVMAVEFFVDREQRLLVNEIAPRPHNSGHYTLDACVTSQFEQQARMLCELPAGSSALHTPIVMVNLLGDLWARGTPPWGELLVDPCVKLHLYGKRSARPGRKMGHFNVLGPTLEEAERKARSLKNRLQDHSEPPDPA